MTAQQGTRRSIWPLVALVLLFFGPMVVSMVLYFSGDGWRPTSTTAHGELIEAPPVLRVVDWTPRAGGDHVPEGKWYLVQVGVKGCIEACRDALVASRQVRRTLGRDMGRVQRVLWLIDGSSDEIDGEWLAREHSGLLVLAPAEPDLAAILGALGADSVGHSFLVDPLGNLILRFPPDIAMHDLQEDLKKLLRASQIG